jgi:hypothetical protein
MKGNFSKSPSSLLALPGTLQHLIILLLKYNKYNYIKSNKHLMNYLKKLIVDYDLIII